MKDIIAFLGSPRKEGNTAIVLEEILQGARKAGAETETVFLHKMDIHGCQECFVCQSVPDEPGCAILDDMQDIYPRILEADVIIFASPVFCWNVSAQLKMMLDRLYCFCKFEVPEIPSVLVQGKMMATVLTAGGDEFDGADLAVQTLRRLADFMHIDYRGHFVAANLTTPEKVCQDTALLEQARAFGKKLA